MLSFTSRAIRKACFPLNKNPIFSAINFNVRHQHEESVVPNEVEQKEINDQTDIINKPTYRKKRAREFYFVNPFISNAALKDLNVISSLIVNSSEIALVKMTKDLTVTEMASQAFNNLSLNDANKHFKSIYPIIEKCKDSDLFILEHNSLPPAYNFINTHTRNLKFMLTGILENNESRKIYQISRINTAKLFGLALGFNRICGRTLASEIFESGVWKDNSVYVPQHFLTDTVLIDNEERMVRRRLTSPTTDAFLQALAFWDFHTNRMKEATSN